MSDILPRLIRGARAAAQASTDTRTIRLILGENVISIEGQSSKTGLKETASVSFEEIALANFGILPASIEKLANKIEP